MRRTAATLALVVSPLFLAACGDKGSKATDDAASAKPAATDTAATENAAPTTASKSAFCAVEKEIVNQQLGAVTGGKKVDVAALKAAYEKLGELGLPAGAPADARKGYEISMDQADKIDWDAMAKDPMGYMTTLGKGVSAEDTATATKFGQWVVTECKLVG